MPKINVLPKEIAQLIAAGEVVERPASVVKELLENAIDAGATRITLSIRGGGVREISMTDNGCGIARSDVRNAFLPHATSKIKEAVDLDSICTLGFRGEALPSIAAVSRVELITHAEGEAIGTRYLLDGREEIAFEDMGCPRGTAIVIRDLFFNTPARMKFLKKDVSEANAIAAVLDRLALSRPDISFRFSREDRQVLFTPGDGNLLSAIRAVFGKTFANTLIAVDNCEGGIRVHGYVCRPEVCRPTRGFQLFFLNKRFVKIGTGAAALTESYKNMAMAGRHPACVLNIDLPEELTDVNVHPAKLEVRFADEKAVFHAVYAAVKLALQAEHTQPRDAMPSRINQENPQKLQDIMQKKQNIFTDTDKDSDTETDIEAGLTADLSPTFPSKTLPVHDSYPIEDGEAPPELSQVALVPIYQLDSREEKPSPSEGSFLPESPPKVIGEIFATYIVIERKNDLLLLDKHAAHERIIYDELKAKNSQRFAQQLLVPLPLTLNKEEYDALLENEDLLREGGFEFTDFQGGTLLVTAAPMEFTADEAPAALEEIAGEFLRHRRDSLPEKLDWLYHSIACRAAIKAGDYTSALELEQFARRVLDTPDLTNCPHGRPILLPISKKEIERRFSRV